MSGDISTYGGLKTALGEYTGRSANTTWLANVPLFVRRAHDVIMRELRTPLLMTTADLTISAERVAVPADFRAVSRLFIDAAYDSPLRPVSIEQRVQQAVTQTSGRPSMFSIEGSYFAFAAIPDTSYSGKLLYFRSLTFFANDAATNDVLTRHAWLYLFGALAEAAAFDQYDESLASYTVRFQAELAAINAAEQADAMGGGTLMPTPSGGVA